MMSLILALAAGALGPSQGIPAADPPGALPGLPPHPPTHGGDDWGTADLQMNLAYEREAKALRAEMRSLQQKDGGELTEEHRAYIQKKATALLTAYHRDNRNVAVNADGSKPH